jgi:epoxyqueuosine reductase QueG
MMSISMASSDLPELVQDLISERVADAETVTRYRQPLVGFASATDPRFEELQTLVSGHLHPRDLLPDAQSVCALFLPFAPQVVAANARGKLASEVWARAHVETNALLSEICATLGAELDKRNVRTAWELPTHNFDPVRLVSAWSHKSVAAIAGLGQLGHHHMLITASGCAGRLASIVLNAEVDRPPVVPQDGDYCAFGQGCRACIQRCPAAALTPRGLDKARCYAQCLDNDARFPQWLCDVCGKCATGPCALKPMRDRLGGAAAVW